MGDKVLICYSLFKSVLLLAECDHILIWKWLCLCDRNVLSNKIACAALEEDCHWNLQFFAWGVWRWKQTYLKVVSQNDLRRCPETWKACMEWCVASGGNNVQLHELSNKIPFCFLSHTFCVVDSQMNCLLVISKYICKAFISIQIYHGVFCSVCQIYASCHKCMAVNMHPLVCSLLKI